MQNRSVITVQAEPKKRGGFVGFVGLANVVGWLPMLLCLMMATSSLSAAVKTWDGGGSDGLWSNGTNWDSDTVPSENDGLVFAGITQLSTTNDLLTIVNSITFDNTAGAFVLAGNGITLTGNITNDDNDLQIINLAMIVSGATTINTASTGSITLGGVISGTGSLTKEGTQALNLPGANTYSGGTTLNAGITSPTNNTAFGSGTVTCANGTTIGYGLGGNHTLANDIVLTSGTVTFTVPFGGGTDLAFTGIISGAGAVQVAGDGNSRLLRFTGANTYTGGTTLGSGADVPLIDIGTSSALGTGALVVNIPTGANGGVVTSAAVTVANSITINSGKLLTLGQRSSTPSTFSGVISGAGALAVISSTYTLSGASTYTGTTTVSAGVLKLASGGSLGDTAIAVASGATFAPNPGSGTVSAGTTGVGVAGATLTLASGAIFDQTDAAVGIFNLQQNDSFASTALTISGATVNVNVSSSGADVFASTLAASCSGTNSIGVTAVGSSLTVAGSYNIIAAPSGLDGGTWQFVGGGTTKGVTAGSNAYLLTLSNTATAVTITVSNPINVWNGTTDTDWNVASNWSSLYVPGANTDIQIGNGSGGSNALAPLVTAAGGTCNSMRFMTAAAAVGAGTGTLTVGAGGIIASVDGSSIACPVVLGAAQTWDTDVNTLTVSGVISGSGALTKTGAGTLTLSGANSLSGGVTLSVGTVNINHATALGTGTFTIAGGTTINNSTGGSITLTANNAQTWNGDFTFTGTSALNLGSGAVAMGGATRQVTVSASTLTISGVIGGSGGLTKAGAGTLTLGGASTYGGATMVSAGTVKLRGNIAPSGSLIHYAFDSVVGATVPNTGSLGSAADGTLQNASVVAGKINNALSFTGSSSGVITNSTVSIGNAFTLAAWVSSTNTNGGYSRIITNDYRFSAYLGTNNDAPAKFQVIVFGESDSSTIPVDTSGTWHHLAQVWDGTNNRFYYDGVLAAGFPVAHGVSTTLLEKFGFGCNSGAYSESWNGKMDDAYIYDRALTPTEILELHAVAPTGNVLPSATALFIASGAALDLSGVSQQVASLADSGGGSGSVTNSGTVDVTLTISDGSSTTTFSGIISDGSTNKTAVTKADSSTQTLTGTNTYTGATTISAGTLQIGNGSTDGSIATSASITDNAALIYNLATSGAYGNVISGSGTLTKTGAGVLTLSGANTFSGGASLSTGTLNINHATALGTGTFTIAGGTTINNSTAGVITMTANNPQTWSGNFTFTGTNELNLGGGAVAMGATTQVTVSASTLTVGGVISGAGGLTKAGAGTLTLGGTSTYSGATIVSAGTVKLNNALMPPVAGYARWFDASTSANMTLAGSLVNQWNDLSGNAKHAVPQTAGGPHNPSFVANSLNGLGAIHFIGGANIIDSNNTNLLFERDAAIRTTFSVFKGASFLLTDLSDYHFHRPIAPSDSDPTNPLWDGTYAHDNIKNGTTYVNGTAVNGTSFAMPTASNNGFNLVAVSTAGNVSADGFNRDRVYNSGDQYQAEVIIYNTVLSTPEIEQVERYLNSKWGLGIAGLPGGGYVLPIGTALSIAAGATLDLNGVSQQVVSLADAGGGAGGSVTNNHTTDATLTVGGSSNTTFSGIISDGSTNKIAVTKAGSSTQTLSGTNTYTGATTISSGTVRLASGGTLGNSAIAVANGATFAANGTASAGNTGVSGAGATLTLASGSIFDMTDAALGTLNLQQNASFASTALTISDATLNVDLSSSGADVLVVTKSASCSGTNSIGVTTLGASLTVAGSYNIITATSGLDAGTWQFVGGGTTKRVTVGSNNYTLTLSSAAGAVTITVSNPVNIWNGTTDSNWNVASNWSLTQVPTANQDVQIGNGSGVSPLVSSVTAAGGTCNSITFTTLASTVGAGTGTLTIGTGGITANVTGSSIACPVALGAAQSWDTGANTLTVSGDISGAFTLTKISSGTLTLSGNSSGFSGGMTLTAGSLNINDANAIGTGTFTINGGTIGCSTVTLPNNVIVINGSFTYGIANNPLNLGTGAVTLGASVTITVVQNALTIGGIIGDGSNGYGITKAGANTLSLTNSASTYTGKTSLTAGTLYGSNLSNAGVAGSFGAPTGANAIMDVSNATTLVMDGTTDRNINLVTNGAGTVTIKPNGNAALVFNGNVTFAGAGAKTLAFDITGNPSVITINTPITDNTVDASVTSMTSALGATNASTFLHLNAVNTFTGGITFGTASQSGTLKIGGAGSLGSGTYAGNITITGASTFEYGSTATQTMSGIISGATANLVKSAASTLTLSGANTYAGTTTISTGTLQIGAGGTTGVLSTSSAITNNAALAFNRTNTITQGADFASVISGSGAVIQQGAGGTLVLTGSNTYTGTTSVQDGTLSINTILDVSGGASAVGAPTSAANGTIALGSTTTTGTLVYTGTAQNTDRVIDLAGTTGGGIIDQSGTGLLKFTSALTATGVGVKTLTLHGSTAGTGEITAAIVDSSSATALVKSGSGTWTLSGTNAYSGATTVNAGTLLVNGSIATSSAVTLASSAMIGGTGTTSGVTNNGGIIRPGSALTKGTLTVSSADCSGGTNSTVPVRVAGYTTPGTNYDRLTMSGALTLGGSSILSIDATGLSGAGTATGVIQSGSIVGTFAVVQITNNTNGLTINVVYNSTSIDIVVANSPPVLAAIEAGTLAYIENAAATAITATTTVADVDNVNLASAVVQITGNYQNGQDVLSYVQVGSIVGTWTVGTGTMSLAGVDSLANYALALRAVKYQNTSDNPNTSLRTVSFTASDGTDLSNTVTRAITLTASNDAPVLAAIEAGTLAYAENASATAITATTTVADADHLNLASATVQITGNYQSAEDVLSYVQVGSIVGTWTVGMGTMSLAGVDSLANYQLALRAVSYQNTSDNPNTTVRTVSFIVNDGATASTAVTRTITLTASNDAPVLAAIEAGTLAFAENAAATAITATTTVADADSINLASAVVQITGNYQNGQDVLSYVQVGNIAGTWTASSGTMTLLGSDTLANYQLALRAVSYQNISDTPSTLVRTVSFTANDGTDPSIAVTRTITITATNDVPVLAAIEAGTLAYVENAAATAITATTTVADADHLNLASAVVQITGNYKSAEDVLSYVQVGNIVGTWTVGSGTMTLLGSDTLVNYQLALRAVSYQNISDNPSTLVRTVSFTMFDGTDPSNTVTRTISLTATNDAPIVTLPGGGVSWIEGLVATDVVPAGTITDSDSSNFLSGNLTMNITNALGGEVLSLRNDGTGAGQIGMSGATVSYGGAAIGTLSGGNASTALVLSFTSTNATPAAAQAALRALQFIRSGQVLSPTTRTIQVVANDGQDVSVAVTTTVSLVPVDDPPQASASMLITVTELPVEGLLIGSDPENGALTWEIVTPPASGTLTLLSAATGAVRYLSAAGVAGDLTFTARVSDGTTWSSPATITVRITDRLAGVRPLIISTPPREGVLGIPLTYQVTTQLGALPSGTDLAFQLIGIPSGSTATVVKTSAISATITWTATGTSEQHQQIGLFVSDPVTGISSYQPIQVLWQITAPAGPG